MVEQNPDPKKKKRGPVRVLLVVSLALNLVVIGIVGGAAIGFKRHFGDEDGPRERFVTPYVKALQREDRRAIGREIRESYRSHQVAHGVERDQYEHVLTVLRSEPFEAAALDTALGTLDDTAEMRRTIARERLVARIAGMSAEQRALYADRLQEAVEHGRRHDKDRDGSDRKYKDDRRHSDDRDRDRKRDDD